VRRQQVSALRRKLAAQLHSEGLVARTKEAERIARLSDVQDQTQRSRLELQFQIDRARTIQHLTEMAE